MFEIYHVLRVGEKLVVNHCFAWWTSLLRLRLACRDVVMACTGQDSTKRRDMQRQSLRAQVSIEDKEY
jgi:hypothetical protein